jgi:hypothetical protein
MSVIPFKRVELVRTTANLPSAVFSNGEGASLGLKDNPGNRFHLKLSWRQNSQMFCHNVSNNSSDEQWEAG